jgi:hypothetical protein
VWDMGADALRFASAGPGSNKADLRTPLLVKKKRPTRGAFM